MALVNYDYSNSESEDGEDKAFNNNSKLTRSLKQSMLPTATAVLGVKRKTVEMEEWNDNVDSNCGRKRTFKHERGNWATYIYIPVQCDLLEELQEQFKKKCTSAAILQLPTDELHISLSRTVVLQYHQITDFVQSLQLVTKKHESFSACFSHLKIYINEERTRTFLALKIDPVFEHKLRQLLKEIDVIMRDYCLPVFYENPSFHVSLLWCLGDQREQLQAELLNLEALVETHKFNESLYININKICCKSGNKNFVFKLI